MANVKISNLPVETSLAAMTGIAGYNANGTAQISGATIDSAFLKSNSDLQLIVDNGNTIDSNAGTGSIIFSNGGSNTNTTMSVNSISSDTSFSIIGTTLNTNLTLTSGGELRITPNASLGTPAVGDVLAAKNALGDVEWVAAGGSASGLGDVLTVDNESDDGQILAMIDGAERLEVSKDQIRHTGTSGDFDIVNSNGTLRLSATGGFGLVLNSSNTIKVLDDVEFDVNGIIDRLGNLGTGGQFLASTGSALEWTTPSSGGLDFSSLNIASIKADLTQSSQTQYGQAVTVKASAAIDNGAVVIWDYSGTEVQAKMPSGSTPDQHEIIGIAIEDIALGATGKVLVYGYVTAKFIPVAGNVVTNLALDSSATVNGGTTIVSDINNATTFTDEGGTSNSYGNNSALSHTFYNNEGNISMKFVNWDIEQAGSSIFDRLGFTVSNDGTNFANATFTPATDNEIGGFRQSSNAVAPWSVTELSGGVPADGYILCESPGGAFPANSVINTGFKYVRAYFTSDSSTAQTGWEIEVYGSQALSNSSVAINEGVFINPNDLSATSGLTNTGRTLGNYISTDVTNNAVVIFVAPARPQQ